MEISIEIELTIKESVILFRAVKGLKVFSIEIQVQFVVDKVGSEYVAIQVQLVFSRIKNGERVEVYSGIVEFDLFFINYEMTAEHGWTESRVVEIQRTVHIWFVECACDIEVAVYVS